MTDPSLQKMQTKPESNVQKMHIPAEPVKAKPRHPKRTTTITDLVTDEDVRVASRASAAANNDDPDFLGYQQDKPNWKLWEPCTRAALEAFAPRLIERLARTFENVAPEDEPDLCTSTLDEVARRLRAQGEK